MRELGRPKNLQAGFHHEMSNSLSIGLHAPPRRVPQGIHTFPSFDDADDVRTKRYLRSQPAGVINIGAT
jgi:hypothetical protein